MTPTRPTVLVVLGVLATAIGWSVSQLFTTAMARTIPVPWTAAATLTLVAAALLVWGLLIRPRILKKDGAKPLSPFVAARTAALAMAASRTGALVAGIYAGIGLDLLGRFDTAVARDRMWMAFAAALAAVLVVAAALWLEHICRLPTDPDDDKPTNPTEETPTDWVLPSSSH